MSTKKQLAASGLLITLTLCALLLLGAERLLTVGDILLYAGALVFTIFIGMYQWLTRGDWVHNAPGRNVMSMMVCTDALLLLNTSYNLFGDWWLEIRPYARVIVYLALAVVATQRCRWLWREQKAKYREKRRLRKKA